MQRGDHRNVALTLSLRVTRTHCTSRSCLLAPGDANALYRVRLGCMLAEAARSALLGVRCQVSASVSCRVASRSGLAWRGVSRRALALLGVPWRAVASADTN